jgi:hypothetical protein
MARCFHKDDSRVAKDGSRNERTYATTEKVMEPLLEMANSEPSLPRAPRSSFQGDFYVAPVEFIQEGDGALLNVAYFNIVLERRPHTFYLYEAGDTCL